MAANSAETELASLFSDALLSPEEPPLPMPRFGKVSIQDQQAQSLPVAGGKNLGDFSLSWIDEDELGIRITVLAEQGPKEIEINIYAEGVRPEMLGRSISVPLMADKEDRLRRLTIVLDKAAEDKSRCSGKGCFGTVADLRNRLGERVALDVFLLE